MDMPNQEACGRAAAAAGVWKLGPGQGIFYPDECPTARVLHKHVLLATFCAGDICYAKSPLSPVSPTPAQKLRLYVLCMSHS
mmetsp:Transcript_19515/g.40780  ORF Transcript_19515/g.40780 Transcript_19515/m.40780 type:complete len:82 (+) Transcript_19515:143-388(+)